MSDLDDLVERWHTSPEDGTPLHVYLGMTWDEYAEWTRTAKVPARMTADRELFAAKREARKS